MVYSELFVFSLGGAGVSLVLVLFGLVLGVVFNVPRDGGLDIQRKTALIKFLFVLNITGALFLSASVIGIFFSVLWWFGLKVLNISTPGRLAWASVFFGIFPLMISAVGAGISRVIGGTLNEGGYKNCHLFGFDIGRPLYGMYVFFWLSFFTLGIAVLGVVAALIWHFAQ